MRIRLKRTTRKVARKQSKIAPAPWQEFIEI